MKDGFLRVACATPDVKVADCQHNATEIIRLACEADKAGASLVVFPELCITAYTCGDLFLQKPLLDGAGDALDQICAHTAHLECLMVVGLPVKVDSDLYNAAAVIFHGSVLAYVPKSNIPNYSEFYELRHFTPFDSPRAATMGSHCAPLDARLLFCCKSMPQFCLGVEICEDLWVANPPSAGLALSGATIIANPSASDEVIGKAEFRRQLVSSQSAHLCAAYLYSDAGQGESSTDLVFSGHNLIAENGSILAESQKYTTGIIYADIDLEKLSGERLRQNTFKGTEQYERIYFDMEMSDLELLRSVSPSPFVPADGLSSRCADILAIQTAGLVTRLRHTNCKCAVVGLSGGLDSTLALLVTVRAFDALGLDRAGIIAITMPCFGTTSRTKTNAQLLAEAYGVSFKDIPIGDTVLSHFRDIGHDRADHTVTFENAQARERTQVLMDVANSRGGIVIGTGDLSELALGWATYNGDHMSMYGVNASVPKTLVRHLVAYEASISPDNLASVLKDILDTPVSPELLPPVDGQISQCTEELVGPYELHDFFLYYALRFGFPPKKIFRLAKHAFHKRFDDDTIKKWLVTFYRRFFAQQFKRSCLPDGPKVGTVALSPRGDWRMPSDAVARLWVSEAESI